MLVCGLLYVADWLLALAKYGVSRPPTSRSSRGFVAAWLRQRREMMAPISPAESSSDAEMGGDADHTGTSESSLPRVLGAEVTGLDPVEAAVVANPKPSHSFWRRR